MKKDLRALRADDERDAAEYAMRKLPDNGFCMKVALQWGRAESAEDFLAGIRFERERYSLVLAFVESIIGSVEYTRDHRGVWQATESINSIKARRILTFYRAQRTPTKMRTHFEIRRIYAGPFTSFVELFITNGAFNMVKKVPSTAGWKHMLLLARILRFKFWIEVTVPLYVRTGR